MSLTVDITADLESRLLEAAAKQGVDPGKFIADAVRARLKENGSPAPRLSDDESQLLDEINRGFSESEWRRYYELVARRQQGSLSEEQYAELTAFSQRIEQLNVRRMECLAELAQLRGTTLPELLNELGIEAPPVI